MEQLVGAIQELRVEHAATQQQLQQAQVQLQNFAGGAPAGNRFAARLPKPELFSGYHKGPKVMNWTHQMENYLRASSVPLDGTSVTFAAGYLCNSALTWYRMYLQNVQQGTAAVLNSWNEFKDALVRRFQLTSPERTARDKLAKLQQFKSARAYADTFNTYMLEIPNMNEQDRIDRFIRGLKPQLRLQAELRRPASLAEAMELAIQVDALLWQNRNSQQSRSFGSRYRSSVPYSYRQQQYNSSNSGPQPMELGCAQSRPLWKRIPGQHRSSGTQPPRSSPTNPQQMRCFFCKQTGHVKRFCPKSSKAAQGHNRFQSAYPRRYNGAA
jgi:hypothetical protein